MRYQGGSDEGRTADQSASEKLRRVLNARSVAVVGASEDLRKPGGRVVNALLHNDFPGKIYPVNPGREQIQDLDCHPSVDAIGEAVDLVILSVPAEDVPDQLRMGCDCGVGGFIVFASGFSETGSEGTARQAEISQIVQDAGVPMIGPNCLGIMNGNHNMLASSTVVMGGRRLPGGNYGFATQSGALGTYWLDMTMKAGLGVSAWISTGNEADVDLAACLDYFAEDDETEVIGLYIEGIRDGAAFRAAARERRCLIPASGFFAWTVDAEGNKLPWFIHREDGDLEPITVIEPDLEVSRSFAEAGIVARSNFIYSEAAYATALDASIGAERKGPHVPFEAPGEDYPEDTDYQLERAFDVLRAGGHLDQLAAAPEGIIVTQPGTEPTEMAARSDPE